MSQLIAQNADLTSPYACIEAITAKATCFGEEVTHLPPTTDKNLSDEATIAFGLSTNKARMAVQSIVVTELIRPMILQIAVAKALLKAPCLTALLLFMT